MSDLAKRKAIKRRHYEKAIIRLQDILKGEIEQFDNDDFEPSDSLDHAAFQLIQSLNSFKSLLEVED